MNIPVTLYLDHFSVFLEHKKKFNMYMDIYFHKRPAAHSKIWNKTNFMRGRN